MRRRTEVFNGLIIKPIAQQYFCMLQANPSSVSKRNAQCLLELGQQLTSRQETTTDMVETNAREVIDVFSQTPARERFADKELTPNMKSKEAIRPIRNSLAYSTHKSHAHVCASSCSSHYDATRSQPHGLIGGSPGAAMKACKLRAREVTFVVGAGSSMKTLHAFSR
eukprot:3864623-Pleurochrysis_carterae.AAC.8